MKQKMRLAGGNFAPPVTAAKLDRFEALAKGCDDPAIKEAMLSLIEMVRVFFQTPRSKAPAHRHVSGVDTTPLEEAEVERIWDHVPWADECDTYGRRFEALTGEIRDAAFHLLWYARELTKDREPLTLDAPGVRPVVEQIRRERGDDRPVEVSDYNA